MKHFAATAALSAGSLLLSLTPIQAQDMVRFETPLAYEDVIFGLENAITDRGLVVDHISHVGEMLERTRADVGSDVVLFQQADVYSFCSAKLSRQVMVRPSLLSCGFSFRNASSTTEAGSRTDWSRRRKIAGRVTCS